MLKELRLKIEYFEIPTQTTTLSRATTCSDEPHQAAFACRYGGPEPTFYAFSRISQRLAVLNGEARSRSGREKSAVATALRLDMCARAASSCTPGPGG